MRFTREGDQYVFEGEDWLTAGVGHPLPWAGTSPRALIRGYVSFILKAQAKKSVSDFVNADQVDLFEARIKRAPVLYTGAPSLLPIP